MSFDIVSVYMIGLFLMKKMFHMCFQLFAEPLFVFLKDINKTQNCKIMYIQEIQPKLFVLRRCREYINNDMEVIMMTNTETCNSRVLDEASKVIDHEKRGLYDPRYEQITVVSVLL